MKTAFLTNLVVAWLAGSSLAQDTVCNGLVGTATLNSSITVDISVNLPCAMASTMMATPIAVQSSAETGMPGNPSSLLGLSVPGGDGNVHTVEVGMQGQLLFNPPQIQAQKGDIILFIFHRVNHTVTESTLMNPCQKVQGGFDSGFRYDMAASGSSRIVAFDVRDDTPRWFFCAQDVPQSHCEAGMVFGLNPGSAMNTFLDNAQKNESAESTSLTASASPTISVVQALNLTAIALPSGSTSGPTSESIAVTASITTFIENAAPSSTAAIVQPPKWLNSTSADTNVNATSVFDSILANATDLISNSSAASSTTTSFNPVQQNASSSPSALLNSSFVPTTLLPPAAMTTAPPNSVTANSVSVVGNLQTQKTTPSTGIQATVAVNATGTVTSRDNLNTTTAGLEQVQTFTGTGISMERAAFGWMLAVSLLMHSIVYMMLA